jgi:hypothetical protein
VNASPTHTTTLTNSDPIAPAYQRGDRTPATRAPSRPVHEGATPAAPSAPLAQPPLADGATKSYTGGDHSDHVHAGVQPVT